MQMDRSRLQLHKHVESELARLWPSTILSYTLCCHPRNRTSVTGAVRFWLAVNGVAGCPSFADWLEESWRPALADLECASLCSYAACLCRGCQRSANTASWSQFHTVIAADGRMAQDISAAHTVHYNSRVGQKTSLFYPSLAVANENGSHMPFKEKVYLKMNIMHPHGVMLGVIIVNQNY